jgi:hypothetical protein
VAWCDQPAIRDEVVRLFAETDDPPIALACLPAVSDAKLVTARLTALIDALPADENGPFGEGYELLVAIGKNASIDAMPIFTKYMKGGSLQRMRSMCHVLRKVHPEWAIQLLSPLLDDQRESKRLDIRAGARPEPTASNHPHLRRSRRNHCRQRSLAPVRHGG